MVRRSLARDRRSHGVIDLFSNLLLANIDVPEYYLLLIAAIKTFRQ
jgi:hypothetical protein